LKTLQKYKPSSVKIVPWEQIELFYIDLISHGWDLENMLSLVKYIQNNDLDKRLFAYTSLDKLFITIYNPGVWCKEALRIEFIPYSRKWHFEYFPEPYKPVEAERFYSEEEGIAKFCKYLKMLKW
jgi:alpha-N-acetylglucosamine transferase